MENEPTPEEIKELKKSWSGKWKLWRMGVAKFKEEPPIYRVHFMQGISTLLTIYMIIFASIYAISVGLWIFPIIILPIGVIGNWYASKAHFMKYRDSVKAYEIGEILKPIEEDVSNLRRRWRIVEKQVGFLFIHITFTMFTCVMAYAYFSSFDLWWKLGIVSASIPILFIIYFIIFYNICNHYYEKRRDK